METGKNRLEKGYTKSKIIFIDNLLRAGCNFGQRVRFSNARMKKYIFSEKLVITKNDGKTYKNKISFFDTNKIQENLLEAYLFLKEISKNENNAILFVGTGDIVKDIILEQAERAHSFYVNSRWLGGTLTNFKTIRKRISYMQSIERMEVNNVMESMPKKEVLLLRKKYYKLKNLLYGIRSLKVMPACLIVGDVYRNRIAIKEANKLKIPVIAIANSNADPVGIDYLIPGNDSRRKSLRLFLTILTDAIMEARFKQESECAYKEKIEWLPKKQTSEKFVRKQFNESSTNKKVAIQISGRQVPKDNIEIKDNKEGNEDEKKDSN